MDDLLSRIGVGSATVDTKVPATVTAGETVDATVEVDGGDSDQEIEGIYFALETRYRTEEGHTTAVVDRHRLTDSFTVGAGEHRTFDARLEIPRETPITVGSTEVWIETGLDIDWALDPDDTDHLEVRPTPRMAAVFDAVESLGFDLKRADPESAPGSVLSSGVPFVQEFEYVPRAGPYRGALDELELVFEPRDDALMVRVEVDRRGGVLAEMTDLDVDERFESITVTDGDADPVEADLRRVIDRHA